MGQINPTKAKPRLAVGKVVFPHLPEALIKTHFRDVLFALQEATMPLRIRWAERWMIPDTLIRAGIRALLREVVVTLALER